MPAQFLPIGAAPIGEGNAWVAAQIRPCQPPASWPASICQNWCALSPKVSSRSGLGLADKMATSHNILGISPKERNLDPAKSREMFCNMNKGMVNEVRSLGLSEHVKWGQPVVWYACAYEFFASDHGLQGIGCGFIEWLPCAGAHVSAGLAIAARMNSRTDGRRDSTTNVRPAQSLWHWEQTCPVSACHVLWTRRIKVRRRRL